MDVRKFLTILSNDDRDAFSALFKGEYDYKETLWHRLVTSFSLSPPDFNINKTPCEYFAVGYLKECGIFGGDDFRFYYKKSGLPEAYYALARSYEDQQMGDPTEARRTKIIRYFKLAADQGHALSMCELAEYYWQEEEYELSTYYANLCLDSDEPPRALLSMVSDGVWEKPEIAAKIEKCNS